MKNVLFLFGVLVLSACLPMSAQTRITACPLLESDGTFLSSVAFFDGPPGQGAVLEATEDSAGVKRNWDFGATPRLVYLVCGYSDGFEKVQKLPKGISSCEVLHDGKTVKSLTCLGNR